MCHQAHQLILVAFANQPLLLIASTTVFTVAKPSLPSTPVLPSAPFVILPVFTSYLTTPFSATDAVVKLPSVKSKPLFKVTVCSFAPLALYLILNASAPLVSFCFYFVCCFDLQHLLNSLQSLNCQRLQQLYLNQ